MRVVRFCYYLAYLAWHILVGTADVVKSTWFSRRTIARPAIVEFPLRCATDLEISAMASSITITPGTLVLGVAAATNEDPPTLFVHSLYDNDRERVLAGLRRFETVLLNGMRKERVDP